MKVGVSLSDVSTTARCTKPICRTGSYSLHRHHKRHQYMFVSAFVRRRNKEGKYREFVNNYLKFRKEDIEFLCESHHAEIHLIYDTIIRLDQTKTGISLQHYSWKQAELLMDKLERTFKKWHSKRTPGIKNARAVLQGKKRGVQGGYQAAVAGLKKQLGL